MRFASPYIHDIIAAYHSNLHNARQTVHDLRRRFPRLTTETQSRFADLAESTIRTWFDSDHKLKPQFADMLALGTTAAHRGPGRSPVFAEAREVENEIIRILSQMRTAGTVVNIHIIRCVMKAVVEQQAPELATIDFSRSFVSVWARTTLKHTWRRSTTAGSKLPEDWHSRGIEMAQRIAANIHHHKVSTRISRH